MEPKQPEKGARKLKKSVHVCPKCGFTIDLKKLSMREGTTGLITCPKCEWSGQIAIGVVVKDSDE